LVWGVFPSSERQIWPKRNPKKKKKNQHHRHKIKWLFSDCGNQDIFAEKTCKSFGPMAKKKKKKICFQGILHDLVTGVNNKILRYSK
jgi:hypothetical protein